MTLDTIKLTAVRLHLVTLLTDDLEAFECREYPKNEPLTFGCRDLFL